MTHPNAQSLQRCCMCLRRLPADEALFAKLVKAYGANGKPWVYVHRDSCDERFQRYMQSAASGLLHGGRALLRARYPQMFKALEEFAKIRRESAALEDRTV